MCGRYAASSRPEDLVEEFEIEEDHTAEVGRSLLATPQSPAPGAADYNVAPTKQAPVVLTRLPRRSEASASAGEGAGSAGEDGTGVKSGTGSTSGSGGEAGDADRPPRQLRLLTWGLVPSWAKDTKTGLRMTNARAESVLDKPAFSRAAASRRCLVPADGWYEWQVSPTATDARGKPRKQPFFVRRADGHPLAMAGLYEFWRDKSKAEDDPEAWLTTYTIITTDAEPGLDRIHDRQPLVLEPEDWADWLDPTVTDVDSVRAHLAFHRAGRFEAYPISTAVNSVRNNGADLVRPLAREDLVGVLDPMTGEIIGG